MRILHIFVVCLLVFVASYIYFLSVSWPVYTPAYPVNYYYEIPIAVIVVVAISVVPASLIWFIKRSSFIRYFLTSMSVVLILGVCLLQLITFLIIETSV